MHKILKWDGDKKSSIKARMEWGTIRLLRLQARGAGFQVQHCDSGSANPNPNPHQEEQMAG